MDGLQRHSSARLHHDRRRRVELLIRGLRLGIDADEPRLLPWARRQELFASLPNVGHAQATADLNDCKAQTRIGGQQGSHLFAPSREILRPSLLLRINEFISIPEEVHVRTEDSVATPWAAWSLAIVPHGIRIKTQRRWWIEEFVATSATSEEGETLARRHASALPLLDTPVHLGQAVGEGHPTSTQKAVNVGCQRKCGGGSWWHGKRTSLLHELAPPPQDRVSFMRLRLGVAGGRGEPETVEQRRVLRHHVHASGLVVRHALTQQRTELVGHARESEQTRIGGHSRAASEQQKISGAKNRRCVLDPRQQHLLPNVT
mmetsp:Transcript_12721/g.35156  ORF Transcript_12721/g.35156 Transcript_12721/m.35156 type:complete len:317 (-) Transcript_12721:117-1067(-)